MNGLNAAQIVEAMVEHVRANLVLDGKKVKEGAGLMTFSGRGATEANKDVDYSLDVVIKSNTALSTGVISRRVKKRSDDGVYTSVLFPKSLDYDSAKVRFSCPYFSQARLLDTAEDDAELYELYKRFERNDVKKLSRVEWEVVLPLCASRIAYYNPAKELIQVHDFQRFPAHQIIPDSRPLDQAYFWHFVRVGTFPPPHYSIQAETFRDIQEGLHDHVRKIIRTEDIKGIFSLKKRPKGNGACVVPCEPRYAQADLL